MAILLRYLSGRKTGLNHRIQYLLEYGNATACSYTSILSEIKRVSHFDILNGPLKVNYNHLFTIHLPACAEFSSMHKRQSIYLWLLRIALLFQFFACINGNAHNGIFNLIAGCHACKKPTLTFCRIRNPIRKQKQRWQINSQIKNTSTLKVYINKTSYKNNTNKI